MSFFYPFLTRLSVFFFLGILRVVCFHFLSSNLISFSCNPLKYFHILNFSVDTSLHFHPPLLYFTILWSVLCSSHKYSCNFYLYLSSVWWRMLHKVQSKCLKNWFVIYFHNFQHSMLLHCLLTLSKSGLCSIDSPPSRILITVAVKNAAGEDYFPLRVPIWNKGLTLTDTCSQQLLNQNCESKN
jgi:hypothetical protein